MCGIAGTLELGASAPSPEVLGRMIRTITHRGPNGTRVESVPPVGLAHARLRVIDLSRAADQPMWNDARTVAVVFNGEIYNFREQRRELEREGRRFRTRSDTEVLLALYERDGQDCLSRLDGMFALAIWDGKREQLLLARDRAGKKPLFYYQDGERFAFASEMKALHAHPGIAREPNLADLPLYLTYGYFPSSTTAYRRVRSLPPATAMVIRKNGETATRRYWSPPHRANGIRRLDEAGRRVRESLERAVVKRLVADVPLGAFLSGGIDSSIVVGLMTRHTRAPVRTFSIGFESESDYDETQYAEEAAAAFGTEHTTFRVRAPEPELFERLVHFHDGPFGDSSAIPTYIVSELARRHVTVVLNGDGGDELFAGYERFVAAVRTEQLPRWVRTGGQLLSRCLPSPSEAKERLYKARRLLDVTALPFEDRFRAWCSFFPEAARELARGGRPEDERRVAAHFMKFFDEVPDGTPLSRLLYLNFLTYLPEDLLVKMDRSTMAHGLEARSPFLDTELVELAASLPDRFKLRGLTTKFVLREAFKDLIPPGILHRGKMGFGAPLGAWFRGPLRGFLTEHLGNPRARLFEHVRREPVAAHLDDHLAGRRDYGQRLFCLLTLEIWLRSL